MTRRYLIFINFKSQYEIETEWDDNSTFTIRGSTLNDTLDRYFSELRTHQIQVVDYRTIPAFAHYYGTFRVAARVENPDMGPFWLLAGMSLAGGARTDATNAELEIHSLPAILARSNRDLERAHVYHAKLEREFITRSLEPDFWTSFWER